MRTKKRVRELADHAAQMMLLLNDVGFATYVCWQCKFELDHMFKKYRAQEEEEKKEGKETAKKYTVSKLSAFAS